MNYIIALHLISTSLFLILTQISVKEMEDNNIWRKDYTKTGIL